MIEHTFFLPIFTAAIHEKYFSAERRVVVEKIPVFSFLDYFGNLDYAYGGLIEKAITFWTFKMIV